MEDINNLSSLAGFALKPLEKDNATPFVSISIRNLIPVIVVTINYRLGLLGFLADEA
ncbi:unnamed protein product, partial [Rotaria magnacalcarata]